MFDKEENSNMFEEIMKSLTDDQQKEINAEIEKAKEEGVMTPEEKLAAEKAKTDFGKAKDDLKKSQDALKVAEDKLAKFEEDEDINKADDILKSASPEVQELFKSMNSQIEVLGKSVQSQVAIAKAAQEEAINKNCETLAKSFEVPMEESEITEILKSAHKADNMEAVTKMFEKVSEIVKKSELVKEFGTAADTDIDAEFVGKSQDEIYDLIEAEAKSVVTKDASKTFEDSCSEILLNPEHRLAKAYYAALRS
jgi:hypothetical protein